MYKYLTRNHYLLEIEQPDKFQNVKDRFEQKQPG